MLTLVHPATSDGTIISWCGKTSHVDNKMLLCFQPLYDYVTSQGRKQTTDANPDFHGMADRVSSRLRRHGGIHPHISQAASHVLHVPQQKVSAVLTYLSSVLRDCFTCLWIVSFSQTYFFQAVTWKSFYSWFSYTCILIVTSWKKCVNSLCLFSGKSGIGCMKVYLWPGCSIFILHVCSVQVEAFRKLLRTVLQPVLSLLSVVPGEVPQVPQCQCLHSYR